MWMHEEIADDGLSIHAYKHKWTRRYLYLAEDGRTLERTVCGRFSLLRQDFAIEAALCTWWLLAGWEQEDVDEIRRAVERVDCTQLPREWHA